MTAKFADDGTEKTARDLVEQDRALIKAAREPQGERKAGKPTPTQEENDLAAHGAHFLEHEDDGSGPDLATRNLEAKPGGGYSTRTVQAKPGTPPPPPKPA